MTSVWIRVPIGRDMFHCKQGCSAETLRIWVRQSEFGYGKPDGLNSPEQARLKELERENRELKRANEILRKAAAARWEAE